MLCTGASPERKVYSIGRQDIFGVGTEGIAKN